MRKKIEKESFTVEMETTRATNGVSCVASVKCFIRPQTLSKSNASVVDGVEMQLQKDVREFVKDSDLLSDNHIVDFECTRENLNTEKWSRVKAGLYLFTPFVECEDELVLETEALCLKVGELMWIVFNVTNRIGMSRTGA